MARTFTSVVTEALGAADFDATTYTTQAGVWLNDALRLLARDSRLPLEDATATLVATAATPTTALPATLIRVLDVFDPATHELLEEVTQEWIDDRDAATATPTAYALYGSTIVWYPTPAATRNFTIHFIAAPADIAGSTVISGVIPDEYGDALVAFIRWHLFRMEDDFEMALAWKNEWTQQKRELAADLTMRGRRIRRTPNMFTGAGALTFRRP